MMRSIAACVLVLTAGLAGCASRTVSNTPRTAIEQLLLSGAVDRALEKLDLPMLGGRKVFVNTQFLQAIDADYVKVAARARLAALGARLVEKPEQAELTVELASGGLGTEYKTYLIGLPALPVPQSPAPLPEAPLLKSGQQTGIFKLLVFVHDHGEFVAANHYYARFDRHESILLWWRFQSKDDIRAGWERTEPKARQPAAKRPKSSRPPGRPPGDQHDQ
jgi:hypothetical protein